MKQQQPWNWADADNDLTGGVRLLQGSENEAVTNTVQFGGLNLREDASTGELVSCKNLSARNWPALSPRLARRQLQAISKATAFTCWNGHYVWVQGDGLYYDGTRLANVAAGEKQFAVINTKLIIWPDKVYIDGPTGKLKRMGADVYITSAAVTGNTITGLPDSDTAFEFYEQYTTSDSWSNAKNTKVFIYEEEPFDASGNRTDAAGEWVWLRTLVKDSSYIGKYVVPSGSDAAGWAPVYETGFYSDHHVYGTENTDGYFGILAKQEDDAETRYGFARLTFQLHSAGAAEDYTFSKAFKAGDIVEVSCDDCPAYKTSIKLLTVSDAGITTTANALPVVYKYKLLAADYEAGNYYYESTKYYNFTLTKKHRAGSMLVWCGGEQAAGSMLVYGADGELSETAAVVQSTTSIGTRVATWTDAGYVKLHVQRKIPDMEYICECSNRLWGVSNKTENTVTDDDGNRVTFSGRAIYASALGDPTNWYDYSGLSTDSYAVGIVSDGDFTGICSYSDDVIAFKEHEVFRVTGSYPAEYYLYDYDIPGLQKGCSKGICIANEILYYMSGTGLQAYNGGTPSLISYPLGDRFSGAVCGTDGRVLYLYTNSMLYSYDLKNRVWLAEDDAGVIDYARSEDSLLMMNKTGIWDVHGANSAGIDWAAEFAKDYGRISSTYSSSPELEEKWYKALYIRGEYRYTEPEDGMVLQATDEMKVYAKTERNAEKLIKTIGMNADKGFIGRLPLPNWRDDYISLRITGTGEFKLKNLQTLYHRGTGDMHGVT